METDGLKIDVGAFAHAIEYACDVKAEIIGKPSQRFFQSVLDDMGVNANEVSLSKILSTLDNQSKWVWLVTLL